jgi:hypothetical protein
MAEFTFETDWTGGSGAIASAAQALAASVAQDAGGAETPGSVSEHVVSLRNAGEDLGKALENMAARIADMQKRNILISVQEEHAQSERSAEAVTALQAAAEGARGLSLLISGAAKPLLDLALTDEAGSVVWERYE